MRFKVKDVICQCGCDRKSTHWKNGTTDQIPLKCVYVLYNKDGKAIYVGSTWNIFHRIPVHLRKFDDVVDIEFFEKEGNMLELERDLIEKLQPIVNRDGKTRAINTDGKRGKPFVMKW